MLEIETCSGIEIISKHATPSSSIPSGLAQNSSHVFYFCLVIDCCCAYPTVSPGAKYNTYLITKQLMSHSNLVTDCQVFNFQEGLIVNQKLSPKE